LAAVSAAVAVVLAAKELFGPGVSAGGPAVPAVAACAAVALAIAAARAGKRK
jgi:hypothetical protein